MRNFGILCLFLIACGSKLAEPKLEVINLDEWNQILSDNRSELLVVNYWATWCQPCVKELPAFMEVNEQFEKKGVKMVLLSLDEPEDLNGKVAQLKERLGLAVDIYILDDPKRMDEMIRRADPNWSGALPATVFYKQGDRLDFHEGELNKDKLIETIEKFL